jgi:hypothetical protein
MKLYFSIPNPDYAHETYLRGYSEMCVGLVHILRVWSPA